MHLAVLPGLNDGCSRLEEEGEGLDRCLLRLLLLGWRHGRINNLQVRWAKIPTTIYVDGREIPTTIYVGWSQRKVLGRESLRCRVRGAGEPTGNLGEVGKVEKGLGFRV